MKLSQILKYSVLFSLISFIIGIGIFLSFEEKNDSSLPEETLFTLKELDSFEKSFDQPINSFALKFSKTEHSLAYEEDSLEHEHDSIFSYRINQNEKWSDWKNISIDEDFEDSESSSAFSKLHFVGNAKVIEIRNDENEKKTVSLIVFNNETKKTFSIKNFFKQQVIAADSVNIIARSSWGADETLRFYDENNPPKSINQSSAIDTEWLEEYADELKIVKLVDTDEKTKNQLLWPLEYNEKIEKIIVHHSAGRTPSCEEEEDFLRSIYKFHTVSRGWGDIGYNFVIGPCSGKIYEGRAGGFGVKGAHAGKFNSRTAGVMIMGNYKENIPSEIAIESTTKLVKFLGEKYGFWPDGYSRMRGIDLPNVIGHRDVGNTNCPGENLEKKLPEIRENAAKNFIFPNNPFQIGDSSASKRKESFFAEPVFTNSSQVFIKPGVKETIIFRFRNSGHRIWNNKTTLKVEAGIPGIMLNGKSEGEVATLKERTVAPGMIGTFEIELNVKANIQPKNYALYFTPVINGVFDTTESSQKFIVIVTKEIETNGLSSDELKKIDEIFKDHEATEKNILIPKVETPLFKENTPAQDTNIFKDVNEKNIFYSYIKDLKDNGIVQGNNGSYYPNNLITRGEFAKIIANATKLELAVQNKSFFDIAKSPFENSIRILQSHNIVRGDQGMYYPDRPISRGEAVAIVIRAFKIESSTDHSFRDIKGIVFESDILKAAGSGIIGKGRIFDPFSPITRDQVAKIVSLARKVNKNILALNPKNTENKIQSLNETKENTNYGPIARIDIGFSKEQFTLKSNSEYDIYSENSIIISNLSDAEETKVSLEGNKIKIQAGAKFYENSLPIRLVPKVENGVVEIVGERRTEYNSRDPFNRYRGEIEVRQDPENLKNLYIINVLPIEKYLWGLGEEPDGQPIEKVKTIVVMARSYIENYRRAGGKFKERFADLKADGRTSQVYLGYNFEIANKVTPKIAKETWGEVLTYNGQVIRAPYFSKSGGHTFTPGTEGNTWNPEPFPFAKRVEDPWSCGKDLEYIKINGHVSCPEEQRGHGVGVSAWGAGRMAEAGVGYKDILKYYLTGIEFEKIY